MAEIRQEDPCGSRAMARGGDGKQVNPDRQPRSGLGGASEDKKLHDKPCRNDIPSGNHSEWGSGRINVALIRAHWAEILRVAASIRTGTVTASLIMRQLASYPRQNGVAAALRELGRLERTLFTLDWIEDPELRRGTSRELNKGESRNSLARAVFIHRLGEIRDRTYENQQHRASGLNLLVTAIILWNTRSGPRDHRPARGRGGPRRNSRPPVTARLGARQSHRRLCLVAGRPGDGKP